MLHYKIKANQLLAKLFNYLNIYFLIIVVEITIQWVSLVIKCYTRIVNRSSIRLQHLFDFEGNNQYEHCRNQVDAYTQPSVHCWNSPTQNNMASNQLFLSIGQLDYTTVCRHECLNRVTSNLTFYHLLITGEIDDLISDMVSIELTFNLFIVYSD